MCSIGFKLIWGHVRLGENLDVVVGKETVWCGVLRGVWHCYVEVQRLTTFDARNKRGTPPPPPILLFKNRQKYFLKPTLKLCKTGKKLRLKDKSGASHLSINGLR